MSKKIFEGLKIAEFAWVGVGPQTARYFGDHGATIVRIENFGVKENLIAYRVACPYSHA